MVVDHHMCPWRAGTAVLRAFHSAEAKGVAIPEVVCFEKQPEWGAFADEQRLRW